MGKYANAAKEMLHYLHTKGIKGGPVAQPTKSDPVIVVYGMTKEGVSQIPKTFAGFEVDGRTTPFEYAKQKTLHELITKDMYGA